MDRLPSGPGSSTQLMFALVELPLVPSAAMVVAGRQADHH